MNKPPRTIKDQINILEDRGLIIDDNVKATRFLLKNNYYRLSDYWQKYIKFNRFKPNVTFKQITDMYELDASLANILLEGIRIFEICFRTRFAYFTALSKVNGQFLYMRDTSYNDKGVYEEVEKIITENYPKVFKKHFKKPEETPVWAGIEVLSFGLVSKMYANWVNKDIMRQIRKSFITFDISYESSASIIHCITLLRNLCAHHVRIWNNKTSYQIPKECLINIKIEPSHNRSHWPLICFLMALVDEIESEKEYSIRVKKLCKENQEFFKGLTYPTIYE